MSTRSLRHSVAAAATGAIVIAAAGAALGAPGATGTPAGPGQAQSASGGERASLTQNPGRGNGGRPGNGGNGGNGSAGSGGNGGAGSGGPGNGGRPGSNPIITPPTAPATPVAPIPRPPVVTPTPPATPPRPPAVTPPGGNGGNSGNGSPGSRPSSPASGGGPATRPANPAAGGGSGGGSASPGGNAGAGAQGAGGQGAGGQGAGGQGSGGQSSGGGTTIIAPPVPKGLATQGLSAGSGPVDVTVYMDLSDAADASTYLSVTTRLLARVANDRSATLTFSPLIMGSDPNSMEAALAVLAGANQNRTWCVTAQVAALRSMRGGDWINRTALRSIARSCKLSGGRFVRDATGNRLYPRLNDIRERAQADGVGATPSYVVKGGSGSQVVMNPGSADAVTAAIAGAS